MNLIPDRKIWATGVSGIVAYVILQILAHYGINPPIDQTVLTGVIAWLVGYLVPPTERDIIKRLDDRLVKIAQDDPSIPVSKPPAAPLASDPPKPK